MGLYSGGLIIRRIFASEIWKAYFWRGFLSEFYGNEKKTGCSRSLSISMKVKIPWLTSVGMRNLGSNDKSCCTAALLARDSPSCWHTVILGTSWIVWRRMSRDSEGSENLTLSRLIAVRKWALFVSYLKSIGAFWITVRGSVLLLCSEPVVVPNLVIKSKFLLKSVSSAILPSLLSLSKDSWLTLAVMDTWQSDCSSSLQAMDSICLSFVPTLPTLSFSKSIISNLWSFCLDNLWPDGLGIFGSVKVLLKTEQDGKYREFGLSRSKLSIFLFFLWTV